MKGNFLFIGTMFCALFAAGCASQGCYRYYSKDFVTTTLNQIPLREDSTMSVIILNGFPVGGVYAYVRNLSLGYDHGNAFTVLGHEQYHAFHVNRRLYLFNLPPNTYYILSAVPDPCRIPKRSMPEADASANAPIVNMNEPPDSEEELMVPLRETNYRQYPLKVEKGTLNVLGVYDVQRDFFSTDAELIFLEDMDKKEEIFYFKNLIMENCKWKKLVEAGP